MSIMPALRIASMTVLALAPLAGCRHDTATTDPNDAPHAASPRAEPTLEPAPSATTSTPAAVADPVAPAPAEPEPTEPAAATSPPAAASLLAIPDATITVADAEADGLHIAELACAVDRAPLMGTLVIIGSLAKHDAAFDRCAPKGDAAILDWRFSDGRTKDVVVRGAGSAKIDACIAAVLRKVAGPFDAHCGVVLRIGNAAGADAAHARLRGD